MAETTAISWCDHTWNPWWGCQAVSPACDHCYAEALDHRLGGGHFGPGAPRRRTSPSNWEQPFKWDRQAERDGVIRSVFACSMGDWFDNAVDPAWRAEAWEVVRATTSLRWLLLTKRPQNIAKMLPPGWGDGWSNVWLGTTVENQAEAERRIPHLLAAPAARRFLSCEPLLGPVDLTSIDVDSWSYVTPLRAASAEELSQDWGEPREGQPAINWVIVGGESGHGARPMHPDWARSIRDQCADAGASFHFKQHGEWIGVSDLRNLPGGGGPGFGAFDHCRHDMEAEAVRVGKKAAGRLLDGVQHDGRGG